MEGQIFGNQSFLADSAERRIALSEIIYQQQIILAFKKLRENNIEPILIKGWSIERFYPPDKKRKTADIDLCVPPEDFEKSRLIIESLKFGSESVDLHRGLRHFDILPWNDLLNNSRLIELHNAQIRVLRPEDNLRVTCVHWLNDGGANKEKLWDIFYLVTRRGADFDWARCLESNGKKRRRWILCAIAATRRYLNLSVEETPFAAEIDGVLPRWFIPALEKEWADNTKIARLEKFLLEDDWKSLRKQLRKRLNPNPIGASINVQAPFDNSPRLPYQMADIMLRFSQHFGRNINAVLKFLRIKLNREYN